MIITLFLLAFFPCMDFSLYSNLCILSLKMCTFGIIGIILWLFFLNFNMITIHTFRTTILASLVLFLLVRKQNMYIKTMLRRTKNNIKVKSNTLPCTFCFLKWCNEKTRHDNRIKQIRRNKTILINKKQIAKSLLFSSCFVASTL